MVFTDEKAQSIVLDSAHDLAKEQKLNFGDEIAYQLRVARKKRFNVHEEKRIKEEIDLQTYLNTLIQLDKEQQLSKLKAELQDNSLTDEQTAQELKRMIVSTTDQRMADLNAMFANLDLRRKVFETVSMETNLMFCIRNAKFLTICAEK